MSPRILECARCGGPVGFRAPFCAYCRSPLAWDVAPSIERGELLYSKRYDGPRDESCLAQIGEGGLMAVNEQVYGRIDPDYQARDTATSIEGIALDRAGGLCVMVRAFADGDIFSGYVASIVPAFGCLRLTRIVEGLGASTADVLADWEPCSAVRPHGQPNVLELRAADSLLEVHVNGQRVLAVVHAGLSFGASGFRLFSIEKEARFVMRRLDVYAAFAAR